MGLILLIILILLLIAAIPSWPYSRGWGYSPVVVIAIIFVIILILVFSNIIVFWHKPDAAHTTNTNRTELFNTPTTKPSTENNSGSIPK